MSLSVALSGGLMAVPTPLWAEIPAIQNMRMHLLEETTVRTEWTPAPGPVDAYEIQFIPTVRGSKRGGKWAALGRGVGLASRKKSHPGHS